MFATQSRAICLWCGLALILSPLAGCTHFTSADAWKMPWGKKHDQLSTPVKVVPMWSNTVMHQPGQPGIRGFAARVYFYDQSEREPIEVDGTLTVYAFSGEQKRGRQTRPEKKFVFTPEQLKRYHSETKLGHSYSIWLPWDEVGGETRQLSLVTRFEGTQGGVVISDPSRKLLPGVSNPNNTSHAASADLARRNQPSVQPASFDRPVDDGGDGDTDVRERREQPVTIHLPPSFARRFHEDEYGQIHSSSTPDNSYPGGRVWQSNSQHRGLFNARLLPRVQEVADAEKTSQANLRAETDSELQLIPPATDSELRKRSARNGLRFQPTRGRLRMQPHPAAWPSLLPRTPRSGPYSVSGDSNGQPAP